MHRIVFSILLVGLMLAATDTLAKVIFFLPPNDADWTAGVVYLKADTAAPMKVDTDLCPWNWFEVPDPLPDTLEFWLGKSGREKFLVASPATEADSAYFDYDKGQWIADRIDYAYDKDRCEYGLAAMLYDVDASAGGFNPGGGWGAGITSCGGEGDNQYLCSGIVEPTLGEDRKPVYKGVRAKDDTFTGDKWGADSAEAAANFKKAFNFDTTGTYNSQWCYDLPVSKTDSAWEYNSDKAVDANGDPTCGFFPFDAGYTLELLYPDSVPPADWAGVVGRALQDAEPSNNTLPGCSDSLFRARGDSVVIRANQWGGNDTLAQRDMNYCFESHAEFKYEPGQVFNFSGDDDMWVFINNQLVIDLGGIHPALPGRVNLDTIKTPKKLVEGETYPIDIFFCERNIRSSNVRLSTNIYFAQSSGLYADPLDEEQEICYIKSSKETSSCAAILSGISNQAKQDTLCGPDLAKADGKLEFYIIQQDNPDTLWLDAVKDTTNCKLEPDGSTSCYNGVIVLKEGSYSCGGSYTCLGNAMAIAKLGITGKLTVGARFNDAGIKNLDQFSGTAIMQLVWGNLCKGSDTTACRALTNTYGKTQTQTVEVVAGRRTPIYVTEGDWANAEMTKFIYNDSIIKEEVYYSLRIAGQDTAVKLRLYGSPTDPLPLEKYDFLIPRGTVDTLWVELPYASAIDTATFAISIPGSLKSQTMTVRVYPPALRFANSTGVPYELLGSGLPHTSCGDTLVCNPPPFEGAGPTARLYAFDANSPDTVYSGVNPPILGLCKTCALRLKDTVVAYADTVPNHTDSLNALNASRIQKEEAGIVQSNGLKGAFKDGWLSEMLVLRGRAVIIDNDSAKVTIYDERMPKTQATWSGLQFRDRPIPSVSRAELYDNNGDGRGDSLVVRYDKSFYNKGILDSTLLPSALVVRWGNDSLVFFNHDAYSDLKGFKGTGEYFKKDGVNFFANNKKYWERYLLNDTTIVIADTVFSDSILTQGLGSMDSWGSWFDDKIQDSKSERSIGETLDKMPAIVIHAKYVGGEINNETCGNADNPCMDQLTVALSEKVTKDPAASAAAVLNPFDYFLASQDPAYKGSDIAPPQASYAPTPQPLVAEADSSRMTYKFSSYAHTALADDSVVTFTYAALRGDQTRTRPTPVRWDWVRVGHSKEALWHDANGNTVNPMEIGKRIEGSVETVVIVVDMATVTPKDSALKGALKNKVLNPELSRVPDTVIQKLFTQDRPVEILPTPSNVDATTAQLKYPSTVGIIIRPDIYGEFGRLQEYGYAVADSNIQLHAQVFLHSSLGNFTTSRESIHISCADPIFMGESGTGSCVTNENSFYLAWDLKAKDGRFVGTGVYIMLYKFYWTITATRDGKTDTFTYDNAPEKLQKVGVRRTKTKTLAPQLAP